MALGRGIFLTSEALRLHTRCLNPLNIYDYRRPTWATAIVSECSTSRPVAAWSLHPPPLAAAASGSPCTRTESTSTTERLLDYCHLPASLLCVLIKNVKRICKKKTTKHHRHSQVNPSALINRPQSEALGPWQLLIGCRGHWQRRDKHDGEWMVMDERGHGEGEGWGWEAVVEGVAGRVWGGNRVWMGQKYTENLPTAQFCNSADTFPLWFALI